MIKKKELWLAFAEEELTCTVAVCERSGGVFFEVELSGTLTPARIYVWDLIMDVAEHSSFDTAILNVRNLLFFSGNKVNDCAIDLILRFVKTFSQSERELHLLLDDNCIKQVFADALPEKKFRSVHFEDSQAVPNPRVGSAQRAQTRNSNASYL